MTIAIELLHAAHARRPDQADVLNALGFALLKARRPAEARAQLEVVTENADLRLRVDEYVLQIFDSAGGATNPPRG